MSEQPEFKDRRKLTCSSEACPAVLLSDKVDELISKVDALGVVVREIEDIKKSFTLLWKVVAGFGATASMLFGVYSFLKDHWKP